MPSAPALVSFGRSSLSCTTCPSRERVTVALRMPRPDCAASLPMSIGAWLSNTSQIVSARRNTAAGVGCANGKVRRSASPWRRTSATTGAAGSAGGAGFTSSASRAGMVAGALGGSRRRRRRQRRGSRR